MADEQIQQLRDAYIDLLKQALLGRTVGPTTLLRALEKEPDDMGEGIAAEPVHVDLADNLEGMTGVFGLPPWAMTMIGLARMDNLEMCVRRVISDGVPGDLIETGVWRGGATIFMRGILRAFDVADRRVYVADSFEGVPAPDAERYPADEGMQLHLWPLAVDSDDVRANFRRYGLLDDQVEFVEGWFRDTLPELRGHQWAVIRLDGDLYESTMDALENLYDGLQPGGWLIVDDHNIIACRQAIADFRSTHNIDDSVIEIDWAGICWQKSR
jgi:hypothetical protein